MSFSDFSKVDNSRPAKITNPTQFTIAVNPAAITQPVEQSEVAKQSSVDPWEFERRCAKIMEVSGWTARTTKGSGDQGVDVIAQKAGVRVVLQCKQYSTAVGNSAVQEVFAGRTFEGADFAAVVSNASYTRQAIELAERCNVILLSEADLLNADSFFPIAPELVTPRMKTLEDFQREIAANPRRIPVKKQVKFWAIMMLFWFTTGLFGVYMVRLPRRPTPNILIDAIGAVCGIIFMSCIAILLYVFIDKMRGFYYQKISFRLWCLRNYYGARLVGVLRSKNKP